MAYVSYIFVIIIWATTPLAIKWSNDSVTPLTAVSLRFALALCVGFSIVLLFRRKKFFNRANYKNYALAAIAFFPNMLLVYYAAEYIPSGLISVIFGMSPFIVGVFAHVMLQDNFFTWRKQFALLIAFAGLIMIFIKQLHLDDKAAIGVLLMFCSLFFHSYSLVAVKRRSAIHRANPFDLSVGATLFAIPFVLGTWFVVDVLPNGLPELVLSNKSLYSILYLGLIGSLVGVLCFYYVVNHLSVSWAAVLPMITPVMALEIGSVLNNEEITLTSAAGSCLILVGLAIYQDAPKHMWKAGNAQWLRFRGLN